MKDNYYVYEYIRLDTNEPFYIGKGCYNRWKDLVLSRSKYFKNIVQNIPVAVVILEDNLTNDEALKTESWYIWQLRDIEGYSLINSTDGGEGTSGYKYTEQQRKDKSILMQKITKRGEEHHLFGVKRTGPSGKDHHAYGRTGENAVTKREVLILKDNEIFKSFKTVGLLGAYIKENFNKPNGGKTVMNRLKDGKEIHGFKLVYKDSFTEVNI